MTSSQTFSMTNAPQTLCLLRLSALGDITHVLPTLRTLQTHWPGTEITWIIGRTEYQMVKEIKGVNFIVFDKSAGLSAYFDLKKQIRQLLDGKSFDVLLHMQLSLRASVASLFIPAQIKLGFDKERAKDLQSVFCNREIKPPSVRQHVCDSFLEFPRHFDLDPVMQWQLPVSQTAIDSVRQKIDSGGQTNKELFVINPCAIAKSKNWRNWTAAGYAEIADFVSDRYNMQVILIGGNSALEKNTASEILSLCSKTKPINLIAATNIDELVAVLHLAEIVLAPDTGPVHIANALNTKTIGLYAATNPDRAGPYNFRGNVVNKYPEALLKYNNKTVGQAVWGERIKTADSMKLISTDDVRQQIEKLI